MDFRRLSSRRSHLSPSVWTSRRRLTAAPMSLPVPRSMLYPFEDESFHRVTTLRDNARSHPVTTFDSGSRNLPVTRIDDGPRSMPVTIADFGARSLPVTTLDNDSTRFFTYSDDESSDATDRPERRNNRESSEPKPAAVHFEDAEDVNKVVEVDTQVWETSRDHHTDKFHQSETGSLIVRRGQVFEIKVKFDRGFQKNKDDVRFVFEYGNNPAPGKGTLILLPARTNSYHAGGWQAKIERVTGNYVIFKIIADPKCIVGEWRVTVESIGNQQGGFALQIHRHRLDKPVYILFNPWCKDDTVYFPNTEKLSEYVLNDSGCIFSGNRKQIGAAPWFFGQFEEGILEAAIFCLMKANNFRSSRALADPIRVTRALSKIVNSNDDNGVLEGNWSGDYAGGTAPLSWVGSVAILRRYIKTKRPVKYGQCFVFSGLLTTICRALGIPCRSVTNFSSAHDTDGSLTIDVHWDTSDSGGNSPANSLNADSIWNFHVWNDVWMRRPDLAHGHDGWQVVDATPQEASQGLFQCGPAPLSAVLNGECNLQYDVPFIFAEVNADRIQWGRGNTGEWNVVDVENDVVGKKISTKVADGRPVPPDLTNCDSYREDITSQYKYREGSDRERMAVLNASNTSTSGSKHLHNKAKGDISLDLSVEDAILIGSDFDIIVNIKNKGNGARTVSGKIICDVTKYTGVRLGTCKEQSFDVTVDPWKSERVKLTVSADEYLRHVTDAAIMKLSLIGRVKETNQTCTLQEDFRLRTPDMRLKVTSLVARVNQPIEVQMSIRNPLKRPLRNCMLTVEFSGSDKEQSFRIGDISPERDYTTVFSITPRRKGLKQIFATLECHQLRDIKGVTDVLVQ